MAHSPHKRWRGCALCKPHKARGIRAAAEPFRVLRKLGKKRRLGRHDEY